MAKRKRLSLCMITRNDEKYLKDCFWEIKQFVDEIIIVDTGSQDQSIDLAKNAGANVFEMEWKNDYSEAKNLCMDQAKGRWILFLRPNETISTEQLKEIVPLLDNPNAEGYLLYIDQSLDHYRITSPIQSLRLIRNRKEYRYQYKSFEYISEELMSNIKDTDIRIRQYADSEVQSDIDSIALLLEDLEEHPESSYLQYMYGIELLNQNRAEDAIIHLQSARRNVNLEYLFATHLYKCLAWSFLSLERDTDALDILDEGLKHFPIYTDLLVMRGELNKRYHRYDEGIQDLENSLIIRELPNLKVPGSEINLSIILEKLGEIHEQLLNDQQALAYYQSAFELNKGNHKLLYKIGELAKKVNNIELFENLFQSAAEQNDMEQLMIRMDILYQHHEYSQVLSNLEYLRPYLGKEQTEIILCSCYLMLGELEKAELNFSSIHKGTVFYNQMLLQRIESDWAHDMWLEARQKLEEMDQIEDIEDPVKAIYHLIHRILTKKEFYCTLLDQQDYEVVSSMLEKLLWLDQVDKAKLLMPILLKGMKDEEQHVRLAMIWAKKGELNVIQEIYQNITMKVQKLEFKNKVITQLLQNEYIEAARELDKMTSSLNLGALEYVLWSKSVTYDLQRWIEDSRYQKVKEDNTTKDGTLEHNDKELSCSEIHCGIGSIYEKTGKTKEALFAYLRALQWDPLNDLAQNKIKDLYDKDMDQFDEFFDRKSCALEGGWFQDKRTFLYYILGLIHFRNQHYWKALESFTEIEKNEESYTVALAFEILCLWFAGNKTDAEKLLDQQSNFSKAVIYVSFICKSCILSRLSEGIQKYPYSEIIVMEKQRVSSADFSV